MPTTNLFDLSGRVAVVTGGNGGIGRGIALGLAQAGAAVAVLARNEEKNQRVTSELQALGVAALAVRVDVSVRGELQPALEKVEEKLGPVSVLVNNAGITRDTTFKKMSKGDWDSVIRTNLDSVFNMTKQVMDGMVDRGWGRVVNVSSVNGSKGAFGQTNYSAAKAGMHGFTKALALEVARKGVTVNTISPGYIGTKMVMAIPKEVLDTKILPQIPLGRLGTPEEIAGLIIYLCSDEAAFVTGANIAINGGQHMQ